MTDEVKPELAAFNQRCTDFYERGKAQYGQESWDAALNQIKRRRGQDAEKRILRAQREILSDPKIFIDVLSVPQTFLEPPKTMRRLPVHRTEEDIDHFAKQVTELEILASRLDDIVQSWERLTPEQQNRRLVLALAERVKALEPQKVEHEDAA